MADFLWPVMVTSYLFSGEDEGESKGEGGNGDVEVNFTTNIKGSSLLETK